MKTTIKTKDLLKLLDPRKGEMIYNNESVTIDFSELKKYVTEPKSYGVFNLTNNSQTNLYKNAALYIINENIANERYIEVDLDKKQSITQGLFEYIKAIYNKQDNVYVSLPESGDNLLLIKAKKLVPLDEDQNFIQPAKDYQLAKLQMLTSNEGALLENQHIVVNEQFFWKQNFNDNYKNAEFVFDKVRKLCENELDSSSRRNDRNNRNNAGCKILFDIFQKTDSMILQDENFILSLFDLHNKTLSDIIVNKHNYINSHPNAVFIPNIDITQKVYQDYLYENIEKEKFILLKILFECHLENLSIDTFYKNPDNIKTDSIDFSRFINHPNTIKYFLDTTYGIDKTPLDLSNTYSYLSKEHQRNDAVLDMYLNDILESSSYKNVIYQSNLLKKLPIEVFSQKEFLLKTASSLDFKHFSQLYKQSILDNGILSNHQTLLHHSKYFSIEQINFLLENNYKPAEITKDLILTLVSNKKELYTYFCYKSKNKNITKHLSDLDVIYADHVLWHTTLSTSGYILKALLTEHDKPEINSFQLHYVVDKKMLFSRNNHYDKPEEFQKFQDKYYKLEYLYLGTDRYTNENNKRDSMLRKIKDKDEVLTILKNINDINFSYVFQADSFYRALNTTLKQDLDIVKKIMELGNLQFEILSQSLQCNKEIALEFINTNFTNVTKIPEQFFNDIDFCIRFVNIVDQGGHWKNQSMPLFINKFFENQEVTEDWETYLKTYISMNKLENQLDNAPIVVKRNKI